MSCATSYRLQEVEKGWRRGWSFTPLEGKKPRLKAWAKAPREDLDTAISWAREGNVGLRTGLPGGPFAIDHDPGADLPSLAPLEILIPTPRVASGREGAGHIYLATPAGIEIPNSAGRLGQHVDVRGKGGQVVFPGSIHPQTGRMYEWLPGLTPDDVQLATASLALLELLLPKRRPNTEEFRTKVVALKKSDRASAGSGPSAAREKRQQAYAAAALKRICEEVCAAEVGTRNNVLNKSAFAVGQFVGAGVIDRDEAEEALLDSACVHVGTADFSEGAARQTICSGLDAGALQPRDLSDVGPLLFVAPSSAGDSRANVRAPGMHVDEHGKSVDIREIDFSQSVLDALPPGVIYRRGDTAGELVGKPGAIEYRHLTPPAARNVLSAKCRIWKTIENREGEYVEIWESMSVDRAALVIDAALRHPGIRVLFRLTNYPVFCGRDLVLARQGWNEDSGTYLDSATEGTSP